MSLKRRLKQLEDKAKAKDQGEDMDYMQDLIIEYLNKEDEPMTDEELRETLLCMGIKDISKYFND